MELALLLVAYFVLGIVFMATMAAIHGETPEVTRSELWLFSMVFSFWPAVLVVELGIGLYYGTYYTAALIGRCFKGVCNE